MPADRASAGFVGRLKDAGARVYVHTVNDMKGIRRLHRLGVDGFYTDFISENEVKTSGDCVSLFGGNRVGEPSFML